MKKVLWLVAVLLVAVLMTQTVPDKSAHKAAMMKAVKEYVDEEAGNRGLNDNILTDIGKSVINKTIETALSAKLKVKNYYLWNTTYVRIKGEEQLLSVGLFGHVFTFDKEMLREKLEEALREKEEAASEKAEARQSARELKKLQRAEKKRLRQLRREERRKERAARRQARREARENG